MFGRLVPLETCDIGFAVDIGKGSDLAPVKVADVDRLSPLEVARAVDAGAARLRARHDPAYRRTSALVQLVPAWTMRPVMAASSLVSGGLGRGLVGQPGFPLGTAFVSNVGTLGLDEAFLAPLPFARTPVYLAVGRRAGPGRRRRRDRSWPARCSCSSPPPTTASSTACTPAGWRPSCASSSPTRSASTTASGWERDGADRAVEVDVAAVVAEVAGTPGTTVPAGVGGVQVIRVSLDLAPSASCSRRSPPPSARARACGSTSSVA